MLTNVQLFWWHNQHMHGWSNVLKDGWYVISFATLLRLSFNSIKHLIGDLKPYPC
jgi:hypothetical protein